MIEFQIDTLGYSIDRIFSNMVKFLNYNLTNEGLEIQHPQFAILMVLSKKDGLEQSALSEYSNRDKATVSRNIKCLEEKGYLHVIPDGGKKKKIFLTEKGKNLIPKLYEIGRQNTETTLKGFSEKKKKEIFDMLHKMYLNISSVTEK